MLIAFEVMDMSCSHCVSTITQAVKELDPEARVAIDLGAHRVEVDSSHADAAAVRTAIQGAGYTPVPA
jgi:copper chaperone